MHRQALNLHLLLDALSHHAWFGQFLARISCKVDPTLWRWSKVWKRRWPEGRPAIASATLLSAQPASSVCVCVSARGGLIEL